MGARVVRGCAVSPYDALIDRLIAQAPAGEYAHPEELPALTDADLATVLEHEPCLLADAMSERVCAVAASILSEDEPRPVRRVAQLGTLIVMALREVARPYLLTDVVLEQERREAEGVERHGCVTAEDAGVPAQGEI